MVARLIYGFRVSIWFALALTVIGTVLGIAAGAMQGYFGGRVDLACSASSRSGARCPSCTC